MPNPGQIRLLDSLIGEDGIYFTTISEDENLDVGTKVLYLNRAITEQCHDFLNSLDKIYNPSLDNTKQIANIEFIRALKVINDLCFNNQIKFSDFGCKPALDHFFSRLGDINSSNFQTIIQQNIQTRINELSRGHEITVSEQIHAREIAEHNTLIDISWRRILDLPTEQLRRQHSTQNLHTRTTRTNQPSREHTAPTSRLPNRLLPTHENTEISYIDREAVRRNRVVARTLTQDVRDTGNSNILQRTATPSFFSRFLRRTGRATGQFFNPRHHTVQSNSVNDDSTTVSILDYTPGTLTPQMRQGAYILLNEYGASFDEVAQLSSQTIAEVFNHSVSYNILITQANIPIMFLLSLETNVRNELLNRPNAITRLINEGEFPFEQLSTMPLEELREIIYDPSLWHHHTLG